jgi:hypothetical protein
MVSDLAHAVALLLLIGVVVVAGSAFYAGVRAVRFWRRVRVSVPARATQWVAARGRANGVAVSTLTDATWWANQRDRHRMWRSVSAADRAVSSARSAGVPIGDLRTVTREIRAAARVVDAGLSAGRRTPELLRQSRELTRAADEVARAATEAIVADAAPLTTRVLESLRVELAALKH